MLESYLQPSQRVLLSCRMYIDCTIVQFIWMRSWRQIIQIPSMKWENSGQWHKLMNKILFSDTACPVCLCLGPVTDVSRSYSPGCCVSTGLERVYCIQWAQYSIVQHSTGWWAAGAVSLSLATVWVTLCPRPEQSASHRSQDPPIWRPRAETRVREPASDRGSVITRIPSRDQVSSQWPSWQHHREIQSSTSRIDFRNLLVIPQ